MISTVTICGKITAKNNPKDLADLSSRFPFVEWEINFGKNQPPKDWINDLLPYTPKLRLLAKLEQDYQTDILEKAHLSFRSDFPEIWNCLQRIRLDLTNYSYSFQQIRNIIDTLQLLNQKEIVIATNKIPNQIINNIAIRTHINISPLLITSDEQPPDSDPSLLYCGYALDYDENILKTISNLHSKGFWLHLGNFSDIDLVEKCLEDLEDYVSETKWMESYLKTKSGIQRITG